MRTEARARAESVQILTDDFPIVVVRCPPSPTRADVDRAYAEVLRLAELRPISLIVDLTPMNPWCSTPALRAHLYETVRRLNWLAGPNIVAEAVVVPNPFFAVLYQTYQWMVPKPARTQRTFPSLSASRRWCAQYRSDQPDHAPVP